MKLYTSVKQVLSRLVVAATVTATSASALADQLPTLTYQLGAGNKYITGSASDPDHPGTVRIGAWIDGTSAGTIYASGGVFTFNIPSQYWDGQPHSLQLNAVNIEPNGNAPGLPVKRVGPIAFTIHPKPTASLHWSPSTVAYGGNARLVWSSNYASNCHYAGQTLAASGSTLYSNRTGNQTASLYCTGSGGRSATVSATLTVVPPNKAPNVNVSVGASHTAGNAISMTANASDSDGYVSKVRFQVVSTNAPQQVISERVDTNAPYTFSVAGLSAGSYTVKATAFDNQSLSSSAQSNFTVNEAPKPLGFTGLSYTPNPAQVGEAQTFSFQYANAVKCWMDHTKNPRWSTSVTYVQSSNSRGLTGEYSWTSSPRTTADQWVQTVSCRGEDGTVVDRQVSNIIQGPSNQAPTVAAVTVSENNVSVNPVTFSAQAKDSDGSISAVQFVISSLLTGEEVSTVNGVLQGSHIFSGSATLSSGHYILKVRATDDDGASNSLVATATEFSVTSPSSPQITELSYYPNPGATGERQTFTLRYQDVYSCWMDPAVNPRWNSRVDYVVDNGALQSGVFQVQTSVRENPDGWVQTVQCLGANGEIVQKSTQNVIEESSDDDRTVAISDLSYEPRIAYIGQTQTFSFTYENARRCWMDADKNPAWDSDVVYVSDKGTLRSGVFTVTTSPRTEERTWTQTVSCEGFDGTVVDSDFTTSVLQGIELNNVQFGPNNPAVVGELQHLEFDYTKATTCYALPENNPDLDTATIYFDFVGKEKSGTYRSNSFSTESPKSWTRWITCEDAGGRMVDHTVTNQVLDGETSGVNVTWDPVQGANSYQIKVLNNSTQIEQLSFNTILTNASFVLAPGNYTLTLNSCISYTLGAREIIACNGVSESASVQFTINGDTNNELTSDMVSSLLASNFDDAVHYDQAFVATFTPPLGTLASIERVEFRLQNGEWVTATLENGTYRYAFGLLPVGSYTLDIRVTDTSQAIYSSSHAFTSNNYDEPTIATARDNFYQVKVDNAKTLHVLANDDIAESGSYRPYVTQQPQHGQVQIVAGEDSDGINRYALRYTPNAGYQGSDELGYRIAKDGFGPSDSEAIVSIDVIEFNENTRVDFSSEIPSVTKTLELPEDGTGNVVGVTAGQFKVSESGAAIYSVPLRLPVGSGSVAPSHALVYNSQNEASGLLGVGWNLSGMSGIGRCPKNRETDDLSAVGGYVKPVVKDETDAFCLDGQRLLLVDAANNTYRKYRDDFSEITAVYEDADSDNPIGFIEYTKSGDTHYYGNIDPQHTSANAVVSTGGINIRWQRASIADPYGTRIKYHYDQSGGEFFVSEIVYGVNTVTFVYEDSHAVEHIEGYWLGKPLKQNKRLSRIEASTLGQEFRTYRLGYDAELTDVSRLSSVRECVGTQCLAPVSFDWQTHDTHEVDSRNIFVSDEDSRNAVKVYDVNSDGLTDIVVPTFLDNGFVRFKIHFSGSNNAYTTHAVKVAADKIAAQIALAYSRVAVISPTGLAALVYPSKLQDDQYTLIGLEFDANVESTECLIPELGLNCQTPQLSGQFRKVLTSFTYTAATNVNGEANHDAYLLTDINGDGISDVMFREGGAVKAVLNNGQGTINGTEETLLSLDMPEIQAIRDEFMQQIVAETPCIIGNGPFPSSIATSADDECVPPKENFFQFEGYSNRANADGLSRTQLDINGDGRQDYVTNVTLEAITEIDFDEGIGGHTFEYSHRTVGIVAYSVGSTYRIEKVGNAFDIRGSSIPVDVNNDGLTDLLIFTHNDDKENWKWYVALSDGTRLLPSTPLPELTNIKYGEDLQLIDYTGDGRVNFLRSTTVGKNSSCPSPWLVNYLDTTQGQPTLVQQPEYTMCHGRLGEEATQRFGDFDGDGLQDWIKLNDVETGFDLIERQSDKDTVNAITTFIDGLGNRTDVDYGRLSDSALYTVGSEVNFPVVNLTSGPAIVKAVHSDDGYAENGVLDVGKQSLTYRYQGLRTHMWGHGPLGFEVIQSIDSRNAVYDIVSTTRYAQGITNGSLVNPDVIATPAETWVERVDRSDRSQRTTLSHKINRYESIKTIDSVEPEATIDPTFTYLRQTVDETAGLTTSDSAPNGNGVTDMPTIETLTTYDEWGNSLINESITTEGENQWLSKTINWYGASHPSDLGGEAIPQECQQAVSNSFEHMQRFGRLSCSQTTKTIPQPEDGSAATQTRTTAFEYFASSGILSKEVTAVGTGSEITTSYEYDDFGNKTKITSQAKDLNLSTLQPGQLLTRETTYIFDTTGRFPLALKNAAGHATCYVYDPVRLVITQETVNVTSCDDLSQGLSAYYTYNSFGEKTGAKDPLGVVTLMESEWCADEPCQTQAGITPYKYRAKTHSDGANPSYVYFDQLGREFLTSSVNFDGTTVYNYSEFDREGKVLRTFAPSSTLSAFVNTSANKQGTMEYDILGRVVKTVVPSFNGNLTTTTTTYDGHKITSTVKGVGANGETISTTSSSTVDALGQTTMETDANGKNMTFLYTPFGHVRKTTDSKGNAITATYSTEGEQLTLHDPDKGFWQYRYNGFGERVYQKDAKNQVSHVYFDTLGRTARTVANATSGTFKEVTCFYYDSAFLGSEDYAVLRRGTDSCAASHSGQDIQRIDTAYDSLSRVTSTTTTLYPTDINPALKQLYTRNYYDGLGRVVISQLDNQYAVLSEFNAHGFAENTVGLNVDSTLSVTTQTLEEILSVNDWGKATSVRVLSGVTQTHHYDAYTGLQIAMDSGVTSASVGAINYDYRYDSFGNLRSRTIHGMDTTAQVETFQYDSLFRLNSYQVNGAIAERYCYDELGNMTAKQDSFVDCATANDYLYGNSTKSAGGNAGVHAVRQIKSRGLSFTYDNNGNMLSDGKRTIAYDHNDKPTQITKAGVQRVSFDYGLGGSRFIRQDTALTSNTDDFGDNQNRRTIYHGAVEYVDVLDSESQQVIRQHTRYDLGGIVLTVHKNTGAIEAHILVQDHLGSTIAVANEQGIAENRYRYEPFGTQRQISTGYLASVEVKGYLPVTQRGFTGHEMLPNLDIIHMNGRIYDPTIGRFLQADPHVQAPSNMQNLNRYSYVLNNPLSYTDPSGYFFKALFSGLDALFSKINSLLGDFAPFVGVALMFTGLGAWALDAWWKAAVYGFATGGVASGSLKGAITGAISGVVFQQIGATFNKGEGSFFQKMGPAHIGAHALAGGILSVLQGGKFGHGFFSAGLTKAININALLPGVGDTMNALRTFVASVVGGTVSAVTGGKFANGAITAGFAQALNGNSFWEKAEEYANFVKDFFEAQGPDAVLSLLPGYSMYQCVTQGCGYMGWAEATFDVASAVAGGGAISAAYKLFKMTRIGRKGSQAVSKAQKSTSCIKSFAPETVVLTYEGYKPISSLVVGELVLARNDETGEATWRPIEAVLNSIHVNDIIELTVQNKDGVTETITTTAEHPFMLRNTGWVDAVELASGDVIAGIHDDNAITVVDARLVETQLYTYNLTVAEDHTYFVGYTDMWVHNANGNCDLSDGTSTRAGKGEVFYKTTKEATVAAKKLGFEKTKFKVNRETVFFNKKTKRYISRDVGSGDGNGAHNGGVWKMAKSVKDLGSKNTRIGTFDANLKQIGD